MITNRLQLALELLQPSDWHRFEKLASAFLASEFDDLRTTASPSGDEGRDSELFAPVAEPKVLLQYSVSADWGSKIHRTVQRIQGTFPDQPRGASKLKAMLWNTQASLDKIPPARKRLRQRLPDRVLPRLHTLEAAIQAALDPREAYNDIPGRDPQIR